MSLYENKIILAMGRYHERFRLNADLRLQVGHFASFLMDDVWLLVHGVSRSISYYYSLINMDDKTGINGDVYDAFWAKRG